MTKRNWGNPSQGKPYPPGCDWQRPPDCYCKLYAHAQACYRQCDNYSLNWRRPPLRGFTRWLANVSVAIVIMLIVLSIITKARGAEATPLLCKPLNRFERSCEGVKAATRVMGRRYAELLARKCGATEEDIAQARVCLTVNK